LVAILAGFLICFEKQARKQLIAAIFNSFELKIMHAAQQKLLSLM